MKKTIIIKKDHWMMLFECFKSLSRKFTVRTRDTFFLRRFWVYSSLVQFSKFGGVFNKKNIPLPMIRACWI